MGAQRILALTSKRTEIMEAIRLLEMRSQSRGGLAINRLLDSLRLKIEWLDKCIDLERQQSDPVVGSVPAKVPHVDNAA
jgi:hypothetical protein